MSAVGERKILRVKAGDSLPPEHYVIRLLATETVPHGPGTGQVTYYVLEVAKATKP